MEVLGYKDPDYNNQVTRIIQNEEKVISSIRAQCCYNSKSYLYRRNDPTVLKGGSVGLSRFFLDSGIFVFSESYLKQDIPPSLVGPYMIISPISVPGFDNLDSIDIDSNGCLLLPEKYRNNGIYISVIELFDGHYSINYHLGDLIIGTGLPVAKDVAFMQRGSARRICGKQSLSGISHDNIPSFKDDAYYIANTSNTFSDVLKLNVTQSNILSEEEKERVLHSLWLLDSRLDIERQKAKIIDSPGTSIENTRKQKIEKISKMMDSLLSDEQLSELESTFSRIKQKKDNELSL